MTRHRPDLFSLVSGLILTGIALVALTGISLDVAAWVWPSILIAVGVVVLATVVGSSRRTDDTVSPDGEQPVQGPEGPTDEDPDRTTAMSAARAEVEEADHSSA